VTSLLTSLDDEFSITARGRFSHLPQQLFIDPLRRSAAVDAQGIRARWAGYDIRSMSDACLFNMRATFTVLNVIISAILYYVQKREFLNILHYVKIFCSVNALSQLWPGRQFVCLCVYVYPEFKCHAAKRCKRSRNFHCHQPLKILRYQSFKGS